MAVAIWGMVMPGRSRTRSSAWLARVPEPRGRPRRPLPPPVFARRVEVRRAARFAGAAAGAEVVPALVLPPPLLPRLESALSAASSSRYSSTSGLSSFNRAWISLCFSSRNPAMKFDSRRVCERCHKPYLKRSRDAVLHDGLLPSLLFQQGLQILQRPIRLALGNSSNDHPAGRRAEDPSRRLELILVLEPGAPAVDVLQPVAGACVGAGRSTALPGRGVRALRLCQRPVHLEIGVAQTQCLVHHEALARRAVVHPVDPAVDGHPFVQPRRVEHHVIHLVRGRVDLDGRPHLAHLAATSSSVSNSRSARSTAAPKRCSLTPNAVAAVSSRGSRSCSSDSISGPISATSSPATAAATTEATGVSEKPRPRLGRPIIIEWAIHSTIAP